MNARRLLARKNDAIASSTEAETRKNGASTAMPRRPALLAIWANALNRAPKQNVGMA